MAKTIEFKASDGMTYTLEFSRRTVSDMERAGFRLNDISDKPVTSYPLLIRGAFKCHHRKMKEDEIDKIYSALRNKDAFIEKLAEMYADTVNSLFDEPEEDEKNAVDWKANF